MSDNTAIIRQSYSKDRVTGKKVPTYPITCIDALVGRNGQPYKDELKEFVADTIDEQGLGAVNIADSIPEAGGSASKLLPTNANAYVLKIGGVNYQAHSVVFGDGDPFLAFCFMHTTEGKGMGYVLFELADATHWKYKAYYEEDDVPEELLKVFNEDLRSTISNLGQKVGNLDNLQTTDKTSLVNALNEVRSQGGSEQMQADWQQTDATQKDYIRNKPTIPTTDGLETSAHASQTYATKSEVNAKQDTINDLQTIREGAALGATALQEHQSLADYETKEQAEARYQAKGNYLTDAPSDGKQYARKDGAWSELCDEVKVEDTQSADLEFSDDTGNVILSLSNGGIRTRSFNSGKFNNIAEYADVGGMHIAFIGDSISSFAGETPSGWRNYYPSGNVISKEQTYWYKVCKLLGATYNNCSYSSSFVQGNSTYSSTTGESHGCPACSDLRINSLTRDGKTPDVVIVAMGTNDWVNGNLINSNGVGTWDGTQAVPEEGNVLDFSSAYALMLSKIQNALPNAKIVCCTILVNNSSNLASGSSFPYKSVLGETKKQYDDAIRRIASVFGCYVLEHSNCGITYNNVSSYTVDNRTHPNENGHSLICRNMYKQLVNIL